MQLALNFTQKFSAPKAVLSAEYPELKQEYCTLRTLNLPSSEVLSWQIRSYKLQLWIFRQKAKRQLQWYDSLRETDVRADD